MATRRPRRRQPRRRACHGLPGRHRLRALPGRPGRLCAVRRDLPARPGPQRHEDLGRRRAAAPVRRPTALGRGAGLPRPLIDDLGPQGFGAPGSLIAAAACLALSEALPPPLAMSCSSRASSLTDGAPPRWSPPCLAFFTTPSNLMVAPSSRPPLGCGRQGLPALLCSACPTL